MKGHLAAAAVAAVALFAFACGGKQPASGPTNGTCANALPVMTSHGARGVVLPSAIARRDLSLRRKDIEGYWVPSEDDVSAVETSLRDAVKARLVEAMKEPASTQSDADVLALNHIVDHLGEYLRQYVGIVINGDCRVLINAFPEDTYCYRDKLIVVEDGGPWFWTIQYDSQLHQFLHWELVGKGHGKPRS